MTTRLPLLFTLLLAGMSCVFLLPKTPPLRPASVRMELPETLPGWTSREMPVSDYERQSLGSETVFAKRAYRNQTGDEIQVIVVLSGTDMNTSIHRPERCLPAQGWTIVNNGPAKVPLASGATLPVTRLSNLRTVSDQNGRPLIVSNLAYYWFVGHSQLTPSHLGRSWIDLRDRLLHGYDQRWAYLTASAVVTDNLRKNGLTASATDALLSGFIGALWPQISAP
jgi:EpsI family protein